MNTGVRAALFLFHFYMLTGAFVYEMINHTNTWWVFIASQIMLSVIWFGAWQHVCK